MLTAKQEKFVQELVKGKSQREAYKAAYDAENMKDRSIDKKASELFHRVDIKGRFEELTKPAADDAVRMREFIIDKLQKIASGEICDKTEEFDSEGNLVRTKRTVKAADVSNAINKLGEYFGVSAEHKEEIQIVIKGAEDYDS